MNTNINPAQVGDILDSLWGYEQTNVDFYKVVKVTPKTISIVPIGKKLVECTGWGSTTVIPDPEIVKGEAIQRRVRAYDDTYYISLDYSSASKWNGKPITETSYA